MRCHLFSLTCPLLHALLFLAQYPHWVNQKEDFIRGQSIECTGLQSLGTLTISGEGPAADDREGLLLRIQEAQRAGDLPFEAKGWRAMELSSQCGFLCGTALGRGAAHGSRVSSHRRFLLSSVVTILTDPSHGAAWERYANREVLFAYSLRQLASLSYIGGCSCVWVSVGVGV